MSRPPRIAPAAARTTPQADAGALAAALGGEACSSRPAHTKARDRAIKVMADHARLVAKDAAGGDKVRTRALLVQQGEVLVQQGEVLVMAGIQLMREGG